MFYPYFIKNANEKGAKFMRQRTDISPLDLAHFRFSLIAPVIQGLYEDKSEAAYYRRITKDPLRLPDGSLKKGSSKNCTVRIKNCID